MFLSQVKMLTKNSLKRYFEAVFIIINEWNKNISGG